MLTPSLCNSHYISAIAPICVVFLFSPSFVSRRAPSAFFVGIPVHKKGTGSCDHCSNCSQGMPPLPSLALIILEPSRGSLLPALSPSLPGLRLDSRRGEARGHPSLRHAHPPTTAATLTATSACAIANALRRSFTTVHLQHSTYSLHKTAWSPSHVPRPLGSSTTQSYRRSHPVNHTIDSTASRCTCPPASPDFDIGQHRHSLRTRKRTRRTALPTRRKQETITAHQISTSPCLRTRPL